MSFDRAVEEIIQAAMARGEFDDLPGKGKPQDHSEYFAMPEEDRLAFSILKNAGVLPQEVALLKEIDRLRALLATARPETEQRRLAAEIGEKTLAFNLLLEQKQAARRRARKTR
jgi:hypothetical protein